MRTIALALLFSLPGLVQAQPVGPVVGHTDTDEAWLWLFAPGVRSVDVRFGGASRKLPVQHLGRGYGRVRVDGLTPNTEFRLRVEVPGATAATFLRFKTAPETKPWGRLRFGAGSCAKWDEQPVWDQVAKAEPEFFLWVGDNTYYMPRKEGGADWDSATRMLERYMRTRKTPNLLSAMQNMPNYAIWDDHDYGPNNSDDRWILRSESRLVHRYMWPNPGCGEDEEGVYFSFRRGPVEFFMMDARFFKDVRKNISMEERKLFGEKQLKWLKRGIEASTAPLKIVAAGQQMLLGYPYAEGWDQATGERQAFKEWLAENGSRVLFISGDIHTSELYQVALGGKLNTWELTASGLANTSRYNEMFRLFKRPERKWIATLPNFVMVDIDIPAPPKPVEEGTIRFLCIAADGKILADLTAPLSSFGEAQPAEAPQGAGPREFYK